MVRAEAISYSKVPAAGSGRTVERLASREIKLTLLIAIAHLPLGLLLYNVRSVAILHPMAVFLVGIYWAVQKQYSLDRVAIAVAYLIGAEVLWRMAQVQLFWEFGKYGSAAIMVAALITRRRFSIPKLPLGYFFALAPACFISLVEFDLIEAKDMFSFNLSGPFLLVIGCWFFSNVRIKVLQLRRILFAIIIPLLSVAFVAFFYTVTIEEIRFTTESNFATSGGFGPNQVSALLGLGVFLAAGCIVMFKESIKFKVILAGIAMFFAAQSMLTFSRGGIYNAVGGLLVIILFHFRSLADGVKRLLPILAFVALFAWLVFPTLNNFTGGKLLERFEEQGTTNRVDIIQSDLQIFQENPVFGVGVGVSKDYRERFLDYGAASHTEFSRMISEHGSFGIIALLCLFAMTVTNLTKQRSTLGRALIAGVSVWSILFMFNAGMRLAAPSFIWSMAFITVVRNGRVRWSSGRLRDLRRLVHQPTRVPTDPPLRAPKGES